MTGPDSAPPTVMSLDELLDLRGLTERTSGFLHKRLKGHLATLSPLMARARIREICRSARTGGPVG